MSELIGPKSAWSSRTTVVTALRFSMRPLCRRPLGGETRASSSQRQHLPADVEPDGGAAPHARPLDGPGDAGCGDARAARRGHGRQSMYTPPRGPRSRGRSAYGDLSHGDGVKVLHETIQYLVERSQDEECGWWRSPVGPFRRRYLGRLRHGLATAGVELRVERVHDEEAGPESPVLHPGRQPLPPIRPARRVPGGAPQCA